MLLTRPERKWYYSERLLELSMPDMGTFRIDIEIENPASPGPRASLRNVLVDTGAELSWFPASVLESLGIDRRRRQDFRQADGTVITRWTGPAFIYAAIRRRPTTSYLANPAIWCSSARVRSRD